MTFTDKQSEEPMHQTPDVSDPIAPIAAAAMEHMNNDHADALLAYARHLAGAAWAQAVTVEHIDATGIRLRATGESREQTIRIAFDPPLTDAAQLRPRLIALAQRAQIPVAAPESAVSPPPLRDEQSAARLFNAIASRRSFSLKELSPEPVDRADIEQMLEAANWAPSHGKTEPWRFVVYTGRARQIIGDAFGEAFRLLNPEQPPESAGERAQRERVWQAPIWIALGVRPDPKMPEWEELIAFGCAVHNMHLMASALGLAAKWTSGTCATHPHVAGVVGFAPATRLLGFLYVGRPSVAWPQGKRRPLADKVRWVESEQDG